ncbi:hypothetical protein [Bradyrhizobium sp. RDI18]
MSGSDTLIFTHEYLAEMLGVSGAQVSRSSRTPYSRPV